MQREYDALIRNKTWYLVPPDPSINVVSNKWLFRVKLNQIDPDLSKKSRLVAKGFTQRPGSTTGPPLVQLLKQQLSD